MTELKPYKQPGNWICVPFKDWSNVDCVLIEDCECENNDPVIWMGLNDFRCKMLLTQEQMKGILPYLKNFIKRGKLLDASTDKKMSIEY
jgi:hypothetical protein